MENIPEQKEKPIARYTAFFIRDIEKLLQQFVPQHERIYGHHSTIAFQPDNLENLEVGKKSQLRIIGRATDEKCDAVLVESPKSTNLYPHITLSCAPGVSPVYANELLRDAITHNTIELFDQPVLVDVVEGYNDGEKDIISQN